MTIKDWIIMVSIIIGLLVLGIVGWHVDRWFNYRASYESQVEETIHRMVKPECLIPER